MKKQQQSTYENKQQNYARAVSLVDIQHIGLLYVLDTRLGSVSDHLAMANKPIHTKKAF